MGLLWWSGCRWSSLWCITQLACGRVGAPADRQAAVELTCKATRSWRGRERQGSLGSVAGMDSKAVLGGAKLSQPTAPTRAKAWSSPVAPPQLNSGWTCPSKPPSTPPSPNPPRQPDADDESLIFHRLRSPGAYLLIPSITILFSSPVLISPRRIGSACISQADRRPVCLSRAQTKFTSRTPRPWPYPERLQATLSSAISSISTNGGPDRFLGFKPHLPAPFNEDLDLGSAQLPLDPETAAHFAACRWSQVRRAPP